MLAMNNRPEQRAQKGGDYRVFAAAMTTSPKAARMNGDNRPTTVTSTTSAVAAAIPERAQDDAPHMHRHMWVVTGTAGSGKTTVAQYLAEQLQVPYIEGDDVSTLSTASARYC